jgi:hypothetical protein
MAVPIVPSVVQFSTRASYLPGLQPGTIQCDTLPQLFSQSAVAGGITDIKYLDTEIALAAGSTAFVTLPWPAAWTIALGVYLYNVDPQVAAIVQTIPVNGPVIPASFPTPNVTSTTQFNLPSGATGSVSVQNAAYAAAAAVAGFGAQAVLNQGLGSQQILLLSGSNGSPFIGVQNGQPFTSTFPPGTPITIYASNNLPTPSSQAGPYSMYHKLDAAGGTFIQMFGTPLATSGVVTANNQPQPFSYAIAGCDPLTGTVGSNSSQGTVRCILWGQI